MPIANPIVHSLACGIVAISNDITGKTIKSPINRKIKMLRNGKIAINILYLDSIKVFLRI